MAQHLTGFAAYPSNLREVTETMGKIREEIERRKLQLTVDLWETNDIAGYCLIDPIRERIDNSNFLLADITRLNFNVVYEIGYAIGKKRRVILVKNRAIKKNTELERELGLFDTLGDFHKP